MNYRDVMKKLLAAGLLVCAATGLSAAVLSAQSLGEVAKREEDRRKAVKSSGKVYTNGSLRPERAPAKPADAAAATAPASAAASPAAAAAPATSPAPDGAAEPKRDETYWKKRMAAEREGLARARTFVEAMQSRINALAADFASRDDPAQRNLIATDRQRSLAELDRLKLEIQQHAKAIADIQEEARRAGVPPGWVR
jgi:gas vesicle protein